MKKKEESEVVKVKARRMGKEKETANAKCEDVEQERDQLKKELREL